MSSHLQYHNRVSMLAVHPGSGLRGKYFLVQVRLTWASMDQLWLRLASKIKFINQGALLAIDKNDKWAGKLIIM